MSTMNLIINTPGAGPIDAWTPPVNTPSVPSPPGWDDGRLSERIRLEAGARGLQPIDVIYLQTYLPWARWTTLTLLGDAPPPQYATLELANMGAAMQARYLSLADRVSSYRERVSSGQVDQAQVAEDAAYVADAVMDMSSGSGLPSPERGEGLPGWVWPAAVVGLAWLAKRL